MTALLMCCVMVPQLAAVPATARIRADQAGIEELKPAWNVGDRWQIETATPRIAAGTDQPQRTVIRWAFEVEAIEIVDQRECFRVRVRCVAQAAQRPIVVFWADRESLALVQVQAHVPTRRGPLMVTENYQYLGGQATPVIGPFPALPIDLPSFRGGQSKGVDDFYYTANPGPAGTKAVDDAGFLFRIRQTVSSEAALSPEVLEHAKAADQTELTQVILQNHATSVRQYWRAGAPWPVLSSNGQTVSRLVTTND